MNMYDEACEIRLAKWEDIPEIMDFVEKEWRHGHILGRDRAFFEYEHASGGVVNFIIARNRETGRLDGMLGFLPASSCPDCLDLWTVMWKTRPGCVPLLGLELMNRIYPLTGCRYALGIGDNPKTTVPLLRRTDPEIKIFRLEHYYLPDDRDDFRIAKIAYRPETGEISGEEPRVCRLEDVVQTAEYIDFSDTSVVPYKDEGYLDHRFFRHPVYDYRVYGLRQGTASALLVTRVQEHDGARALRIVDWLGDQRCFAGLNAFFREEMKALDCEYTDFFVSGFQEDFLTRAGFAKIRENDENVIPDYFHPFEQRNVQIWADGRPEKCLFCKADGDQDRPC